jgi:hypothetical protein
MCVDSPSVVAAVWPDIPMQVARPRAMPETVRNTREIPMFLSC